MTKARNFLRVFLGLLVLALLLIVLRACWWEPSSLRLSSYTLAQSSPALKGLRIAVISDLHGGSPYIDTAKIDQVVAMTNAARPDLVLLTGDYVISHVIGGHHMAIETIAERLKKLHAPLGVYAVLGNHDRWEDAENIARVLRQAGIPVLDNTHLMLPAPRSDVALVGIGDRSSGGARPLQALSGVTGPALCFTHSPDIFPRLRSTCVLTVAGHTHGGQVWLPFLGRPAVAILSSRYGQKYAAGTVQEDGNTLFVSTGIGTSLVPVRLGVPPEVSLLTLH